MVPVVSIVLAIVLPIAAIRRVEAGRPCRTWLYGVGSFVFCAAAMIRELMTIKDRLLTGDIGGIEDTIGAVLLICIALLAVTTVLNLFALGLSYGEGEKEDDRWRTKQK